MAFGLQKSSGGDYLPIVKYDAKAGRIFRVDRNLDSDIKTQTDITQPPPKFAVDFGTLEVGYISFDVSGPDFRLAPAESCPPEMPMDKDDKGKFKHRQGFRLKLYGKRTLGGAREFASTAVCVVQQIERLYLIYKQAPEAAIGKIPVVELTGAVPVVTGRGAAKTTSYSPLFRIVDWTDRPAELGERTVPVPCAAEVTSDQILEDDLVDDPMPF